MRIIKNRIRKEDGINIVSSLQHFKIVYHGLRFTKPEPFALQGGIDAIGAAVGAAPFCLEVHHAATAGIKFDEVFFPQGGGPLLSLSGGGWVEDFRRCHRMLSSLH